MHFPARLRFRLCTRVLAAVVAGAMALALSAPVPVAADPIEEKRAEAQRLATELEEQARQVSVLTEDLNEARVRSGQLEEELAGTTERVARAGQRVDALREQLRGQAVEAYVMGGNLRAIDLLMSGASEAGRIEVRSAYVRSTTSAAADTLDRFRAEQQALAEERSRLRAAREDASRALAAVEARRREAAAAHAQQERTLARAQGELAELVAAEARRRAEEEARRVRAELEARQQRELAARRAREARDAELREAAERQAREEREARARHTTTTTTPRAAPKPSPAPPPDDGGDPPPPPANGAAAAVAEARRQIGKPYEWGAAGPNSFDCSGLTQWSWKAGGRYLPHSSRAQYSATSRVALADIQPGDLLFFGPSVSGIHHVGIYAGDGQMIEASQTGTPVRYASIYRRDLVGIGRVN